MEAGCVNVTVDFSKDANDVQLPGGAYVDNEWEAFGLVLSSSGGLGTTPRLFDTANPGTTDDPGDFDLGSPNIKCSPPGPGRGGVGNPGKAGENCVPLGNVLIIQEDNADTSIPDDKGSGGTILFDFVKQAAFVYEIGFLDFPVKAALTVVHVTSLGMEETVISPPHYGNNAAQKEVINIENVEQIRLDLGASGSVSSISFCYDP